MERYGWWEGIVSSHEVCFKMGILYCVEKCCIISSFCQNLLRPLDNSDSGTMHTKGDITADTEISSSTSDSAVTKYR